MIQSNLRLVVSIAKNYRNQGLPVPRPHPGGHPGPDPRGREVRLAPRLQVLDVRDVVDPPGGRACARGQGADDPHAGAHRRADAEDQPCRAAALDAARAGAVARGDRRRGLAHGAAGARGARRSARVDEPRRPGRRRRGRGVRRLRRGRRAAARGGVELNLRSEALRHALAALPQREREVVVMRYGLDGAEPQTLEEIGSGSGSPASACARSSWSRCAGSPASARSSPSTRPEGRHAAVARCCREPRGAPLRDARSPLLAAPHARPARSTPRSSGRETASSRRTPTAAAFGSWCRASWTSSSTPRGRRTATSSSSAAEGVTRPTRTCTTSRAQRIGCSISEDAGTHRGVDGPSAISSGPPGHRTGRRSPSATSRAPSSRPCGSPPGRPALASRDEAASGPLRLVSGLVAGRRDDRVCAAIRAAVGSRDLAGAARRRRPPPADPWHLAVLVPRRPSARVRMGQLDLPHRRGRLHPRPPRSRSLTPRRRAPASLVARRPADPVRGRPAGDRDDERRRNQPCPRSACLRTEAVAGVAWRPG